VSAIAAYMGVSRQTVYSTLRRWIAEEFAGMPDRSRAPKNPTRKVDLTAMREIKQPTVVWLCSETLTVEHEDEPLSQFTVKLAPDKRHLAHVGDPRLFETRFTSPQPFLWYMEGVEWHKVMRADEYAPRRKRVIISEQLRLFPNED